MTLAEQLEQKGLQKGQSVLLKKQLQLKFGALSSTTMEKLEAASGDDLELWGERVLSAEALEDVFK